MAKKRKQAVKRQSRAATQSPELVTWALHGIQQAIESTRARLAELEAQARKLRGATKAAVDAASASLAAGKDEATPVKATRARKKRKLSPDARRRIADAQKRRWAKVRKEKAASTS